MSGLLGQLLKISKTSAVDLLAKLRGLDPDDLRRVPIKDLMDPLTGTSPQGRLEGIGLEGLFDILNAGMPPDHPSFITVEKLLDPSFQPHLTDEAANLLSQALHADAKNMPASLQDPGSALRILEDPASTDDEARRAIIQLEALRENVNEFPSYIDRETGNITNWGGQQGLPIDELQQEFPIQALNDEEGKWFAKLQAAKRFDSSRAAPPQGDEGGRGSLTDIWNQRKTDPFQALVNQKDPGTLFRLFSNPKFSGVFDVKETQKLLKERIGEDWETRVWEDLVDDETITPISDDFVFQAGRNAPGHFQTYTTTGGKGTAVYFPEGGGTPVRVPIKQAGYSTVNSVYDEGTDELRSDALRNYLTGEAGGHEKKLALRILREKFTPDHVLTSYETKGGVPIAGKGLSVEQAVKAHIDPLNISGSAFSFTDEEANWVDRQITEYVRERYGPDAIEKGGNLKFDAADSPIVAHIVNAANNAALARSTGAAIDDPGAWYNLGNVFHSFRNAYGDSPAGKALGQARFLDYINMIGATTSASQPFANFRSASWYHFALSQYKTFGAPLRKNDYAIYKSLDNSDPSGVDTSDLPDEIKEMVQTVYPFSVRNNLPNRVEWEAMQKVYPGTFDRGKGWIAPGAEGKEGGKFIRKVSDDGVVTMVKAPQGSFKRFQKALAEGYRKEFPGASEDVIKEKVKLFEPKAYINPYWGLPAGEKMGPQPAIAMFKQSKSGAWKQQARQIPGSSLPGDDPRVVALGEKKTALQAEIDEAVKTGGVPEEEIAKMQKKLAGMTKVSDSVPAYAMDEAGAPMHPLNIEEGKAAKRAELRGGMEIPKEKLDKLAAYIKEKGGVTYDVVSEDKRAQGYSVAPFKNTEEGIDVADWNGEVIREYILKWQDMLDIEGAHYGVWFKQHKVDGVWDGVSGEFMQDISVVVNDEFTAAAIGRAGDQDAIFDMNAFDSIYLKTTDTEDGIVKGIGETYDKAQLAKLKKAEAKFAGSEFADILRETEGRISGGIHRQSDVSASAARYAEDPVASKNIEKAYMAPPYAGGAYYNTWQKVMEDPIAQAQFFRELFTAAYKNLEEKNYATLQWPTYFRVNPLDAQKAGHFIGNLAGEELSATIDKVMSNILQVRGKKGYGVRLDAPEDGAYVFYDEFVREIAKGYDMNPRDFQAMAWVGDRGGGGASAGRTLQERFKISSALINRLLPDDKDRMTPDLIRILWMKGAFPLLTLPAAMMLGLKGSESPFDVEKEAI